MKKTVFHEGRRENVLFNNAHVIYAYKIVHMVKDHSES